MDRYKHHFLLFISILFAPFSRAETPDQRPAPIHFRPTADDSARRPAGALVMRFLFAFALFFTAGLWSQSAHAACEYHPDQAGGRWGIYNCDSEAAAQAGANADPEETQYYCSLYGPNTVPTSNIVTVIYQAGTDNSFYYVQHRCVSTVTGGIALTGGPGYTFPWYGPTRDNNKGCPCDQTGSAIAGVYGDPINAGTG